MVGVRFIDKNELMLMVMGLYLKALPHMICGATDYTPRIDKLDPGNACCNYRNGSGWNPAHGKVSTYSLLSSAIQSCYLLPAQDMREFEENKGREDLCNL